MKRPSTPRFWHYLRFDHDHLLAEIVIVKKFWPDFRQGDLFETVKEYQRRHRRFGAL